ncbi:hypothetical protein T552_02730 [Pneumocystis carinii B80]|uniref:Anamorsin C-terminal domain-containing protein n=1 Tax=Pneumocystis carinii (strain B80) TaxID=1408658 RepID=A0A0W4ZEC2_PNEC8|nr:hypothetical protein T552_02730 [Pneumocystis carinii B80]KTW26725.1 hypothetical protein T552_02730 [Pneumocystis carinii B80]
MGSERDKQEEQISNKYLAGEYLLNGFFPVKKEGFLREQEGLIERSILMLLPGNSNGNMGITMNTEGYCVDMYSMREIYTGLKALERELYERFILVSTEEKSLNEFILILNHVLMSVKCGKGGRICIENAKKREEIRQEGILQGWNVDLENGELVFLRPIISENSVPLPKKKGIFRKNYNIKVDNIELINEDDLLESSDLIIPTYQNNFCNDESKRKKKRCKNCTCGLRQEETEITEKIDKMTIHLLGEDELGNIDFINGNNIISNCGNCYLGDAFRCSKCPYFGMPAFKPGEKIQLKQSDLE